MFIYVLVIAIIMYFNDNMARKSRIRPLRNEKNTHDEALRILASLIAQFHMEKITGGEKPEVQAIDIRELNNDQSLS